ncbi:MAG: c-type cytochrome [Planctomycetota bacterium]|nr:c-type cytochrome [Planctomycetota bacterium]
MRISHLRAALIVIAGCFVLSRSVARAQDTSIYTQDAEVAESLVRTIDSEPAAEPKAKPDEPQTSKKLDVSAGPKPDWIWGVKPAGNTDRFYFRKQFSGGVKSATVIASCDNSLTIYINGKSIASHGSWETPVTKDVTKVIQDGANELVVEGANSGGQAGLVLKLVLVRKDGKRDYIVTDSSWTASRKKDEKGSPVVTLGKLGIGPWMNVFANPRTAKPGLTSSTPRGVFNVLPGFQVETLFTVPKGELGSWVSITFDDKGRLIASDQGGKGLCRITPPPIGGKGKTKVERLKAKITSAHGMLYAFDSLYVSVNGGPGSGLYRLRDTTGDDDFDEVKKLKDIQGGGEHGPHALRLSPDGKSIYLIAGNHTDPPKEFQKSRMRSNWSEDLLLPRQWDARGHARGKLAPGGWIAKTDPDGKTWEIISNGYRNPYDMDFNADGELFAYDADMEWDLGSPWYRPTRVVHATSGSEFGWRSGTGKWAPYYIDSLPEAVDIGPGSPTGVAFGYGTKFPAKYQKALFIVDWTFGTMYAIHNTPSGASYASTKEEFVSRTPLPLTDVAVGRDGALYFTVGGRGAQSELFRVTYIGKESTATVDGHDKEFAELRALRHKLESFHNSDSKGTVAIDAAWPHLGHEDRWIRYAARTAIEHQPAAQWQEKVFAETKPMALMTAAVALARQGDKSLGTKLLATLNRIDFVKLTESQQLDLLRTYALVFVRMGAPRAEEANAIIAKLDSSYPAKSDNLNRELVRVLGYLNSPTVITKTLKLMAAKTTYKPEEATDLLTRHPGYGGTVAQMLANYPEIQKIHYAFVLRTIRYGWTLDQRREYFAWFVGALTKSGGASYQGFINNIRKEALDTLSAAEKTSLASETIAPPIKKADLPKPQGPGKKWTLEEIVGVADVELKGRNFEAGKRAFAAAQCVVCHRFGGEGGATGPDLTNVAGRFSVRDLTESLTDPSKVVSDQYRASIIETTKGKVINGRIVADVDGVLSVMVDPVDATKTVEVKRTDVESITPSKTSLMPKDLLNQLNKQEVLDLMAYMLSRGNPTDRLFALPLTPGR